MSDYTWKHEDVGWYVVEHGGMLQTGPFPTKEYAEEWFKRELDVELEAL